MEESLKLVCLNRATRPADSSSDSRRFKAALLLFAYQSRAHPTAALPEEDRPVALGSHGFGEKNDAACSSINFWFGDNY